VPFSRAECSPLLRAHETAKHLLADRSVPLTVEEDLAEGAAGDLAGLAIEDARRRYPRDFSLGVSVIARLAASGRTAPGGEPRERFLERARRVSARWRRALEEPGDPLLVVSHGGLLNYALQDLFGVPSRDETVFGFVYCGVARLISLSEKPGFGPFASILFAPPEPELRTDAR
jgi:broad specificity phosphatase PhoE